MFSVEETARYQRHFSLPQMGYEGQAKLKAAKVLVIGAGGLGSPLLLYLAAAGVGKIGIMDADVVSISNLQRQILYSTVQVGQSKAENARERLLALNPHIEIEIYPFFCNAQNALAIFAEYDVIADGSDNFPTRYLVNDACFFTEKPLVYAAIHRFEGQLAVFNWKQKDGRMSANYRDVFPTPPPPQEMPNCAEAGVLGVLPGIFGTLQALEIIKIITNTGEILANKFFTMNTLTLESYTFSFAKDTNNPLSGENPIIHTLIDYEVFCNVSAHSSTDMCAISPKELLEWIQTGKQFQLIDVRTTEEYAQDNLEGVNICLDEIAERYTDIVPYLPIVVHCQSGKRSQVAIKILQEKGNFAEIYNLTGGLSAFRRINLEM
jgi:sulfur-carrier protein adenylyltransferase/sulfurtransferase